MPFIRTSKSIQNLLYAFIFLLVASLILNKAFSRTENKGLLVDDGFQQLSLNSNEIRNVILNCSAEEHPSQLHTCNLSFYLDIQLQEQNSKHLVLTIHNPILRHVSVDIRDSKGLVIKHAKLGMLDTLDESAKTKDRQSIEFEVKQGERYQVNAKIQGLAKPTMLIDLYSKESFIDAHELELVFSGAIIALLIGGAFYNTFIYLVSKSNSYVWYLVFYFIAFFYFAAFHGFGYLIWSKEFQVWLGTKILPLSFMMLWIVLQFSIGFLNAEKHAPHLTKMRKYFDISLLLFFIGSFSQFVQEMMLALLIAEFAIAFYCIQIAISALKNGFYPARFFILSWTLLLSGAVIGLSARVGILPVNTYTFHAFFIGSLCELMLLSVALADRLKYAERLSFKYAFTDPRTEQPNLPYFNSRYFNVSNEEGEAQPAHLILLKLKRMEKLSSYIGPNKMKLLYQNVIKRLELYLSQEPSVVTFRVAKRSKNYMVSLPDDVLMVMLTDNSNIKSISADLIKIVETPVELDGVGSRISSKVGLAKITFKESFDSKKSKLNAIYEAYRQALVALNSSNDNKVNCYSSDQDTKIGYQISLLNDLQKALERKSFSIAIQPQFDNLENRLVGGEVLVRWNDKDRGWVPPGEFIQLAEETGNIYPITKVVIEQAMQWLAKNRESFKGCTLSINLSAYDIHSEELFLFLDEMVNIYKINPKSIMFEITESAVSDNHDDFIQGVKNLKALGFSVALDDFGTGYSSMNYLQQIEADEIKIDISFVRNIHNSPINQNIVGAIIGIAYSMNAKVIAEGVETKEELELLSDLGVNLVQGYLLGKPIPSEDFIKTYN